MKTDRARPAIPQNDERLINISEGRIYILTRTKYELCTTVTLATCIRYVANVSACLGVALPVCIGGRLERGLIHPLFALGKLSVSFTRVLGGLITLFSRLRSHLSRRMAENVPRILPPVPPIATRVRQRVVEKTQLWGPSFSLSRQFEFHDPRNRYGRTRAAIEARALFGRSKYFLTGYC